MLIMPILNTSKNGVNKIYNIEVKLKTASKVKENTEVRGLNESDIFVNGKSFNESVYNIKNKDDNVVVNFIRQSNYRNGKKDFLITTRSRNDSTKYDLYHVEKPPVKVTSNLDRLYGKAILDMQKEIPGITKGKYISLSKLGVDEHITEEKITKLRSIVEKVSNEKELDFLLQANNISDLKSTMNFIKLFNFTIINEATISEEQLTSLISSLEYTNSSEVKKLKKYYEMSKSNRSVYKTLTGINKIIYSKPLNIIHKKESSKVLVKTSENKNGREYDKKVA